MLCWNTRRQAYPHAHLHEGVMIPQSSFSPSFSLSVLRALQFTTYSYIVPPWRDGESLAKVEMMCVHCSIAVVSSSWQRAGSRCGEMIEKKRRRNMSMCRATMCAYRRKKRREERRSGHRQKRAEREMKRESTHSSLSDHSRLTLSLDT